MIITKELSEEQLHNAKDQLFKDSKEGKNDFNGLLELIMCRENLIHAIKKVKAKSGFKSAGVDKIDGYKVLAKSADEVFNTLEAELINYQPRKLKQIKITKSDGTTRLIGIPTITDKIIQTAVANIIEPILEAKFYEHSYGYRPMRSIEHVDAYLHSLTVKNQRHFVFKGDIKDFFGSINHNILIDKLFKYGVQDKRVLMIIKKMLKAGIDGVNNVNDIGTPQGGSLSTLLANVYLTDFDHWINNQWNNFSSTSSYATKSGKTRALRNTNLKMGYLIRYADDFIIVTDSYESATKWMYASKKYLSEKLKLELSTDKSYIIDLREEKLNFLGYSYFKKLGSNGNYTLRSCPNVESLNRSLSKVYDYLKSIRKSSNKAILYENILKYNSVIRSINNYYQYTTLYNIVLGKADWQMRDALNKTKNKQVGKRVKMTSCDNFKYSNRSNIFKDASTIAFEIEGSTIGLEKLGIGKFRKSKIKAQWINPYSKEGRDKYEEITGTKWMTFARNPQLTLVDLSNLIAKNLIDEKIYNLEYFINRPIAFNRDGCRCKMCGKELQGTFDTEIHHKNPNLPIDKVNKLTNLVTLCTECHYEEHHSKKKVKEKKLGNNPIKKTPSTTSKKPNRETLLNDITSMPIVQVAKKYGVSDNGVKKWCLKEGIWDLRLVKKPRGVVLNK